MLLKVSPDASFQLLQQPQCSQASQSSYSLTSSALSMLESAVTSQVQFNSKSLSKRVTMRLRFRSRRIKLRMVPRFSTLTLTMVSLTESRLWQSSCACSRATPKLQMCQWWLTLQSLRWLKLVSKTLRVNASWTAFLWRKERKIFWQRPLSSKNTELLWL